MNPIIPVQVTRWAPLAFRASAKLDGFVSVQEILATVKKESFGDPLAVNPGDPSWGLMQVTSLIAREFAGIKTFPSRSLSPLVRYKKPSYGYDTTHEIFVPENNVKAGAGFLAYLKKRYAKDHPLILPSGEINPLGWVAAYNEGEPNLWKKRPDLGYVTSFVENLRAFGASL